MIPDERNTPPGDHVDDHRARASDEHRPSLMGNAPPRPCPRCGRRVLGGGRCPRCQRPTAHARGYRSGWKEYARAWLVRFPWCGQREDGRLHDDHSWCVRRHLRTRARVVDHIRSIASGGSLLDASNLQSLCVSCNTRKG